jgi:hypothetical protein
MIFYKDLIITILLFLITALVGFFFRKRAKVLNRIFWTISGLILFFLIAIVPLNYYYANKRSKYLIGTYRLDIDSSKYDGIDLKKYRSLKMIVKDDHTFSFSQKVPFLQNKDGDWFYWIDGDKEVLEFTFDGIRKYQDNITFQKDWIFEGQSLPNALAGNRIFFVSDRFRN